MRVLGERARRGGLQPDRAASAPSGMLLLAAALAWALVLALPAGHALAAPPAPADAVARRQATEAAGLRAYALGQYQEALAIYRDLYVQSGGRPEHLRDIGRCLQNLGQYDKAIETFREYMLRSKRVTPEERQQLNALITEMEGRASRERAGTKPATAGNVPPPSPSAPAPLLPAPAPASPPPPPPASQVPSAPPQPQPAATPVTAPLVLTPPPPAPPPAPREAPRPVESTAARAYRQVDPASAAEAERASFSVGRLIVEFLLSTIGGGAAAYGVFRATCGDEICLGGALAAFGTNVLATPTITWGVGRLMGGKGTFSSAFYGAAVGLGIGAPISGYNPNLGLALGVAMMPVFAPLGFELSSQEQSRAMKATLIRVRVAPALWPVFHARSAPGAMLGFAGTLW